MKKPRILLADDHIVVLRSLQRALEPAFDVCGTATNGRELLDAAARLEPDVIVVDVSMPLLDGIEAARRLSAAGCTSKVIFLSVHRETEIVEAALSTSAAGYVLKANASEELEPAIRAVEAGGSFVSPELRRDKAD